MRTSGTNISATGHKAGLGKVLYDKAGARPDLDLDFARTKSLKDRVSKEDLITFTRSAGGAKAATYVDENGLIKVARHNLVHNSHDISLWNKSSTTTLTANAATAPDGTNTATKVVVQTGTGTELFRGIADGNNNIDPQDTEVIWSIYLKSAASDGSNQTGILSITGSDRRVITITNQWQRFELKGSRQGSSSNNYAARFGTRTKSASGSMTNRSHTGDTNETIEVFAWGAQMEVIRNSSASDGLVTGLATELIKTTTQGLGAPRFTHDPETLESKGLLIEEESTNLIPYSQDFSQSEWSKEDVSLDSNTTATTAPDGTNTASLVTATGSTSTVHRIKEGGFSLNTNPYTLSAFIKFNTSQHVLFKIFKQNQGTGQGNIIYKRVKLNTDGSLTIGSGGSGTLIYEKYPNGWYRFLAISGSSTGTHNGSLIISLLQNDNTAESFVANSESLYVWGVQLEQNTFGTSYIPTSGSTVTRSPDLASIEGDNFGTYRKNITNYTNHLGFYPTSSPRWLYGNTGAAFRLDSNRYKNPIDGKHNATFISSTLIPATENRLKFDNGSGVGPANNYVFSVYVKAVSNPCRIQFFTNVTNNERVVFNLITNNVFKGNTNDSAEIQDVGTDGWKRLIWEPSDSGNFQSWNIHIRSSTDDEARNGASGSGSGTNEFYIYGPQIEEASAVTPLIPSTDTFTNRQSDATFVDGNGIIRTSYANRLKYSEQLDQAAWTKSSGSSITPNNVVAPDGTTTADTWSHDSTRYGFYNNSASSWMSGHNQVLYPFTITDKWVRYSISLTTDSGQTSMWIFPLRTNDNQDYVYQTDIVVTQNTDYVFSAWYKKVGTKVYVWGCQLVKGSEAGDYYKTTDTISGPPRYNHDPETLTPTGLYLELASTNFVKGFPETSTDATRFADFNNNGWTGISNVTGGTFTQEYNEITPSGKAEVCAKALASGGNHGHGVYIGNNTTTSSTYLSASFFAKQGSISTRYFMFSITGITGSFTFDWETGTFSNTSIGNYTRYKAIPLANGWYKFEFTGKRTDTTPYDTKLIINFRTVSGSGYNPFLQVGEHIFIWGAQLEESAYSSSTIPLTVGATETRSADTFTSTATEVLDRANGTKPAFYTKSGISIYTEAKYNASSHDNITNYSRIFALKRDASSVMILYKSSNQLQFYSPNPAAAPLFAQRGYNTGSGDLQVGLRYAEDDARIYMNFNQSLTDRQGSLDANVHTEKPTDLFIGNNGSSGAFMNGTMKRLTFWKTPLPDSKLERITS